MPADVRRFVAACQERYRAPASSGALAAALSGYFRFRTTRGDQVHGLMCKTESCAIVVALLVLIWPVRGSLHAEIGGERAAQVFW